MTTGIGKASSLVSSEGCSVTVVNVIVVVVLVIVSVFVKPLMIGFVSVFVQATAIVEAVALRSKAVDFPTRVSQ